MNPRRSRTPSHHPVNQALVDEAPLGVRVADDVTGFMGSWRFIVIQTVIVIIWIAGNVYLIFHFDPYPFILLNLVFSTQAAYAAPLILLAQNRQEERDRAETERDRERAERVQSDTEYLAREIASIRLALSDMVTTVDLDESIDRLAKLVETALGASAVTAPATAPPSDG